MKKRKKREWGGGGGWGDEIEVLKNLNDKDIKHVIESMDTFYCKRTETLLSIDKLVWKVYYFTDDIYVSLMDLQEICRISSLFLSES